MILNKKSTNDITKFYEMKNIVKNRKRYKNLRFLQNVENIFTKKLFDRFRLDRFIINEKKLYCQKSEHLKLSIVGCVAGWLGGWLAGWLNWCSMYCIPQSTKYFGFQKIVLFFMSSLKNLCTNLHNPQSQMNDGSVIEFTFGSA